MLLPNQATQKEFRMTFKVSNNSTRETQEIQELSHPNAGYSFETSQFSLTGDSLRSQQLSIPSGTLQRVLILALFSIILSVIGGRHAQKSFASGTIDREDRGSVAPCEGFRWVLMSSDGSRRVLIGWSGEFSNNLANSYASVQT